MVKASEEDRDMPDSEDDDDADLDMKRPAEGTRRDTVCLITATFYSWSCNLIFITNKWFEVMLWSLLKVSLQ